MVAFGRWDLSASADRDRSTAAKRVGIPRSLPINIAYLGLVDESNPLERCGLENAIWTSPKLWVVCRYAGLIGILGYQK